MLGRQPKDEPQTEGHLTLGRVAFHLFLFVLTFLSCTFTGLQLMGKSAVHTEFWPLFWDGIPYAIGLLSFLTVHEFGHYFAARHHRIKTTLPYYIPMPFFVLVGTMGAVISIKQRISLTHELFDVGVAGPLAGFVVALVCLIIGLATLPQPDYLFNFGGHDEIHQHIRDYGNYPQNPLPGTGEGETIILGQTLLFWLLSLGFEHVPPMFELYHFPFLYAGWLALLFTALNLMPVGQLDGGHILYALVGYQKHKRIARGFVLLLLVMGGVGAVPYLNQQLLLFEINSIAMAWGIWALAGFVVLNRMFLGRHHLIAPALLSVLVLSAVLLYAVIDQETANGFSMWGIWAFILTFFVGIEHPPVVIEQELDRPRKILGWLSMLIFVACISPTPIFILN